MRGKLQIFSTRSMREYAERVAHILTEYRDFAETSEDKDFFGELKVARFADGEMEVEVPHSIRGRFTVLFANASRNIHGLSTETNKIEMYHAVDALKRSQAGRLLVFEPFCSSSRSDRTNRRNSVGIWMHFKILTSLGVNHIITYQLHSDKTKTVIDPTGCAIDDIPALILLKRYICDVFIKTEEYLETVVRRDWSFCSVDVGGEGLAKQFASSFGAQLVLSHKQRDYTKPNTVNKINILSSDSIEGKTIWIVDDMIDTAGSVAALVEELAARGVAEINIAAIHPVFSDPAIERLKELHARGLLANVVVTDTVPCPPALQIELPFLHVVSSSQMSAEIIASIYTDRPMSRFFLPFDIREYLTSPSLFL